MIAMMALMNQTHILSVTIAKRRDMSPAQVFRGTVESSVMVFPHVQISGTNYFLPVNLTNPIRLMLPSAVSKTTSSSVKMDQCA